MAEESIEATALAEDPLEPASSAADDDAPSPAHAHDGTPERIGRYLVLRKLGAGAMGMVVIGYDPELDRKLAIKLIHPRVAKRGEARSRMLREAKGLARLSHPNVVQVYDAGAVDGRELGLGRGLRRAHGRLDPIRHGEAGRGRAWRIRSCGGPRT